MTPGQAAAFECLEGLLRSLPAPVEHRRLLALHVREVRRRSRELTLPAVELPSTVFAALGGRQSPAELAALCLLVFVGADLFDDVTDRELSPAWEAHGRDEANLAAATLLAAVPHFALERLAAQVDASSVDTIRESVARALVAMSAGQFWASRREDGPALTPARARRVAELYAGGQFKCYAEVGAIAAGADDADRDACASFGQAFGTAIQITSDLGELCTPPPVSDLFTRKATVPIAHALAASTGRTRERLESLLDEATQDRGVHEEIQALVRSAGSIQYTALVVGIYRQRALSALATAPSSAAMVSLRTLADDLALISRR